MLLAHIWPTLGGLGAGHNVHVHVAAAHCHSRLGDMDVLGDAADGSAANLSCIVVTL